MVWGYSFGSAVPAPFGLSLLPGRTAWETEKSLIPSALQQLNYQCVASVILILNPKPSTVPIPGKKIYSTSAKTRKNAEEELPSANSPRAVFPSSSFRRALMPCAKWPRCPRPGHAAWGEEWLESAHLEQGWEDSPASHCLPVLKWDARMSRLGHCPDLLLERCSASHCLQWQSHTSLCPMPSPTSSAEYGFECTGTWTGRTHT